MTGTKKKKIHKLSISYLRKGDNTVHDIDYSGTLTERQAVKEFNLKDDSILWFSIINLDGFTV